MPPTMKFLFAAPNKLYQWRLGWLLTKRMVQIEHVGRKSGLIRRTVLEVVEHSNGEPVIVSGFGENSAWLLNITSNPNVGVNWSRESFPAVAVRVDGDEAYDIFLRYINTHRTAAKTLQSRLGLPLDDPRAASQMLPVIRLTRTA